MTSNGPTSSEQRILLAGFGGQGILTLGKLLCLAAMNEGKQVAYMPSYGAEVRGGTANCHVVVSSEPIFSPIVETADSLIIMNQLSFEKFGGAVRPAGLMVLNTSMANPEDYEKNHDVRIVPVLATEWAADLGTVVVANVVMLGAFIRATSLCSDKSIEQAILQSLEGRKTEIIETNLAAYKTGAAIAEDILDGKQPKSPASATSKR